jgi:hypothetical protein
METDSAIKEPQRERDELAYKRVKEGGDGVEREEIR